MKFEKKLAIKISEEERSIIKEILDIVEEAFNIEVDDDPDVLAQVMSGICYRYDTIPTSLGDIEIEYEK